MSEEVRLQEAVERSPRSVAARQALGRYYLRAGQPFEAVWELDQVAALAPGERETRVDLATALALARLYPEAEETLRAAIQPQSRVGRRELAALYLAVARPEAAIAVLIAAPGPEDWPEGQRLLGRAREALGQTAAACRAYERLIQRAPEHAEGPFRLAHLLLTSGDPRRARSVLEAALRKWPREARLLQLLAMTYSARWGEREEPDRQGELLAAALRSGGDEIPGRLALGELYLRHRRFQEGGGQLARLANEADLPAAQRGLAIVMAGLKQPAEAAYRRGMAAVFEGQTDAALREFQTMAALAPRDRRVPQLICQAYAQMNQLNAALKAGLAFYRAGNRSPELYERLATLYLATYDRRAGRRLCEEWRRTQPDSGRPLAYLGKFALADLRLTEAIAAYEQAVAREPRNVEHLLGLAEALNHVPSPENARRALSLLRQAAALAPLDARLHYQLGVRLQQMGQWEEARRELLRALDDDPAMAAADSNLVQVAIALRQPALARRFAALMRATQERKRDEDAAWRRRWSSPAGPQVSLDLTRLQVRSGNLTSADYQLRRALTLQLGWPEAAALRQQIGRLLDGTDADGRRLVSFDDIGLKRN
jgi:tetratricopeptide (TPR) repeat protein